MTERRVLIASLLSVVCISLYSQALMRKAKPAGLIKTAPSAVASATANVQAQLVSREVQFTAEDTKTVESEALLLEIGSESGAIRSATLKGFKNAQKTGPLILKGETPLLWIQIGEQTPRVESVTVLGTRATLRVLVDGVASHEVAYTLDSKYPVLKVSVAALAAQNSHPLSLNSSWLRSDDLASGQNRLEAHVAEPKIDKIKYHHFGSPWKGDKNVPRGTFLALSDRYFSLIVKSALPWSNAQLSAQATESINAQISIMPGEALSAYLGPRDFFRLRDAGFEKAFPIGILGQIGLVLLSILSWMAGFTRSYGIAIILFSVLVTTAMAPFTLLGFRSMKRMQELKPQVDKIMAQHKNDPQKTNKEIFQLYKENKVSPLGGCLPMLLQMPIFIALFQAITHYINLRGASFLQIRDLSLPDKLISLPVSLPFVGTSINVLPIIMAVAMYLQTRASQKNMGPATDNPTAKMMSGPLMPIMFLFMFYQFPAGLVLYWLTNSLMSMLFYKLASK